MTEKQVVFLTRSLNPIRVHQGKSDEAVREVFEFVSEPIVMADNVVLVDATEKRSGQSRRVRIPLPIVHMANGERTAA